MRRLSRWLLSAFAIPTPDELDRIELHINKTIRDTEEQQS